MNCKPGTPLWQSVLQLCLFSVLMYPPTGIGALSIMNSDLRRLEPEEYLNDTLIEFGLKYAFVTNRQSCVLKFLGFGLMTFVGRTHR